MSPRTGERCAPVGFVDCAHGQRTGIARRKFFRIAFLEFISHRSRHHDARVRQFLKHGGFGPGIFGAANAEVDDLDFRVQRGRERAAVKFEIEILIRASRLGVVKNLPAMQPAVGDPRDSNRVVNQGCNGTGNMRAMTKKITRGVSVVMVRLDRLFQIGVSVIDSAVQHGHMKFRGVRMLAVEPADGAQSPLPVDHRVRGAQPSVRHRLNQIHGLRRTQPLQHGRCHVLVLDVDKLKSGQRFPWRAGR